MARSPGLYSGRNQGNVTIVGGAGGTTFGNSANATSNDVTLPANMQVGDLMVMCFRCGASGAATMPAGWSLAAERDASGVGWGYIWFKRNTGESGTQTVTHDSNRAAAITYAIRGSVRGCEAVFNESNSANPPPLVTSWPSQYQLFIALYSTKRTDNEVTTAPTDYVSLTIVETIADSTGTAHVTMAAAHSFLTADTDNPTIFIVTGNTSIQLAATIAVA